jgi:hypothetical protein
VSRRSVSADERGAMALIAVFFAVFAVAMLYSLLGTVETVFFRERMQDAADSTALSSAVMHARAMNFVVLVNLVMAALLALLVALKLVEALCWIAIAIAVALAWPTMGASLVAVPPLKVLESQMEALYGNLKPPIDTALEALNEVSTIMSTVAPEAADALVQAELAAEWEPPVQAGFVKSGSETLPVENDAFPVLCGKAGWDAAQIATLPLEPVVGKIPGGDDVLSALKDATGSMTGALSDWFCGAGGSRPPSFRRNEDRDFPELEATTEPANASPTRTARSTVIMKSASRRRESSAIRLAYQRRSSIGTRSGPSP